MTHILDQKAKPGFGASIDEIEPIAAARLVSFWLMKTADPMMTIVRPGYFDSVLSHGLRAGDRIEVVSIASTPATHATLAIDEIRTVDRPGDPRVFVRPLALDEGDLSKGDR